MTWLPWALRAALCPWRAFPGPFPSARSRMAAVALARLPLGLGATAWALHWAEGIRLQLATLQGPWGEALIRWRGDTPVEELREALGALPRVPPAGVWLLLAVPLGLAGLWLHHLAWDHAALWLVGGLRRGRGWRATARAEAEALVPGALGTLLSCLGFLPGAVWASPLLLLGAGWFWVLRGFALAAHHGCEPWRGLLATLVHGGLFLVLACGFLVLAALLAAQLAA